ncbi:uncharacterized protein [Amphiura filiformis]|uniref:uncharacterized protein n=1 Tax=Amphiura filiformis TaxID=82378 RepID=UPI003B210E3A
MDVSNMDSLKHPDSSFVVEEFSAGDIPMDVAHTVEISIDMTQDSDDGVHSPMVFHGGDIQSSIVFLGSEGVIDGDEEPTIHVEERCDGIGEEASGFKSDEQLTTLLLMRERVISNSNGEDGENHVQVGKSMGLQSQTVTSDDIMVQEQCQGTSQEHVRGLEQENPICNNCQVSHVSNIDCRNGQMSIGQQLHKGPSSIPSYRAAIAGDDDGINIQKPTEPDSDSNVCRVAIAMPKDAESRTEETALLQTIPILHPLTFQPQVSHSIIIPLNTGAPPTSKQQYVVQMGGGGADTAEPIPHKTGAPPLSQQQYLVPMDSGSTEPMFNFVLSHNAPSDRTRTTYGNRYVEIQPNVSGIHPNVSGKYPNESGKHPNMKFNTQAVTACLPSQKEVNELQSVSNMSQNVTQNMSQNMSQNVTQNMSQNMSQNVTQNMSQNVTQNMSQNLTQNMSQNVTKYNKSSKSVNPQKRQPQWCEQSMQDALRAVGHGKSVRSVAKEFSIPHQTLVTRIKRLKVENSFKKYEPGGDRHTAGMMVDVPHKKTRGKQKCLWTCDQMEAAIQLCKEGHSLNYAAKIYGIPVGTLHGRVSGKVKRGGKRGSPSYLTVEEEAQLETLILKNYPQKF